MNEITPSARLEIAEQCGVAEQYLYQVFTRRKIPSAELCVLIERVTGGKVTRQELRPDDYWLIWPDLPTPAIETQGV